MDGVETNCTCIVTNLEHVEGIGDDFRASSMTDMGISKGVLELKRVRYGRNGTIWGKENGFEKTLDAI